MRRRSGWKYFATVKQLQKENGILKQELLMYDTLHNCGNIGHEPLTEQEKQQLRNHVVKYLDGEVNDLQIMNLRQLKEMFIAFKQINRALQAQVEELRQKVINQGSSTDSVSVTAPSGSTVSGTRTINARGAAKLKTGANGSADAGGTVTSQYQVGDLDLTSGYGLGLSEKALNVMVKTPTLHPDASFLQVSKRSETSWDGF
ncbi:unnamed protein product [Echinostoma caproni]|uniref:K-box domain-containing protein n=1 Tax=Echinostoma caproni TaxID=27848 RepID=A0A183AGF9_9TREM|nr:unnamed protein product [Echinostoma caproni]